jgi:hypothetical protein
MSNNQRFERISGSGTALLGLLALAYVLFGPLYQGTSSSGQSETASLLQLGIHPISLVAFGIFLLALIGVVVSAVLHSSTEENKWRIMLGGSVIVILAFTLLTLPGIGLFILPSAFLALVTFVLSLPIKKTAVS